MSFHLERGGRATIAVRRVTNASRYGTVRVNSRNQVTGFTEKTGDGLAGLMNAGVYAFNRLLLDSIPEGPSSLERDIFPQLLNQGVFAIEQGGLFIDIGTPEDFARAQQLCDSLYEAASLKDTSVPIESNIAVRNGD